LRTVPARANRFDRCGRIHVVSLYGTGRQNNPAGHSSFVGAQGKPLRSGAGALA
jgi:hypothetical protein